jgi:hypothetical protein
LQLFFRLLILPVSSEEPPRDKDSEIIF